MSVASLIFFGGIAVIGYTFVGYPLLLMAISVFNRLVVRRAVVWPTVTVIVPVHNGQSLIEDKLENCLSFDYPSEKLSILVASDGSTDTTEDIVEAYSDRGVELVRTGRRVGKVAAQSQAARVTDSDIVVFTDAAITMQPDAIRLVVENFADPEVGAVSCRDHLVDRKEGLGESSYIRYDMLVRTFASRVGTLIGVTGGFYAVRRELVAEDWNPAFPPDFFVALHSIRHGFRVLEDDRVAAFYGTAAKQWDEVPRKVRTLNRGMHAFFAHWRLLNPRRYGFVSFQLLSHKLLRWLLPMWLLGVFCGSIALAGESRLAAVLLMIQLAVYGLAVAALLSGRRGHQHFLFRKPLYFAVANFAILKAWFEFLTGKRYVQWTPTKR